MYIFQVNDKLPISDVNMKFWSNYLEEQCKKDTAVLLPTNIDFIGAMNLDSNVMLTPILDTTSEYNDIDGYEDIDIDN